MSSDEPTESVIPESDARAMVRLLGEISANRGSGAEKRKMLMDGLVEMIDADAWCWGMLGRLEAGSMPTFSVLSKGGFSEQRFADYLKAQEHPAMRELNAPFLMELAQKGSHLTRLRQHMDPTGIMVESGAYKLWQKADIGPIVLSMRPLADGQTSGIALFRSFDREDFNARESRIAHILLSEVTWLHEEVTPGEDSPKLQNLSPRLNTVLNLLTHGQPRKEIATQLEISIHTVNEYVKELYARFDVHSQSELIRRFIDGDGGDRPS